jgi:hypothetical protein
MTHIRLVGLVVLIAAVGIAVTSPVVWILVDAENRNREETPARIDACHRLQGTARLDRSGVYRGCLVPPPATRRTSLFLVSMGFLDRLGLEVSRRDNRHRTSPGDIRDAQERRVDKLKTDSNL